MTRRQKTAIARIFADLIKADRIVDTGEMECWRSLCGKYSIDRQIRIDAREMSFAEALREVCDSGLPGLGEDLLGDCRAMTVSDGFCAHSEALLMIALITMLDPKEPFRGQVFSIPRADFNIDIATALYVESEYDEEINAEIDLRHRSVFKELQLAGFHFVYIPKIIDHYRNTEESLFKEILSFLAPDIREQRLEEKYRALMRMTTSEFCTDLLCNKCGIRDLRSTLPSLLIKIGNSYVGEAPYANYLKIEIEEDIMETVQRFVDRFSSMLSSDVIVVNTSEERDNQFHFHGFYKQLLDIFLVQRNVRSGICINLRKNEIAFPDIDKKASDMNRRERALYALFLCQGADGLRFTKPRTAADRERYDRRMKRMQKRYAAIYGMFGGDNHRAPDLSESRTRSPIITCMRGSIEALRPYLYNADDYLPTELERGWQAVHVDPSMVTVVECGSDSEVPLLKSDLYRRWKKEGQD